MSPTGAAPPATLPRRLRLRLGGGAPGALGLVGGVLDALLVLLAPPRLAASPITALLVGFWALLLATFTWLVPDGSGQGVNLAGIEWVIGGVSLLGMATALGVCGLWLRPRLRHFTA